MTTTIHYIADTYATRGMEPNYEFFLSYHFSSSVDCVTLGNRRKYPIADYVTKLVRLGGRGFRNLIYLMPQ